MEAEEVTTKLCNYLSDSIYDMFSAVKDERYEEASIIRDSIDYKIKGVSDYIIKYGLSTLKESDLNDELDNLKWRYIRMWEDILEVPREMSVYNI